MKLEEPTFGAPCSPSIGHHWDQKKKLLTKIKNGMFLCAAVSLKAFHSISDSKKLLPYIFTINTTIHPNK